MKYVQIKNADPVVDHAIKVLSEHLLLGERVLWLLSGGSAIELEVRIARALQQLNTSRLTIGLIDERYGPLGHADENHTQLMGAYFPLPIHRVLTGKQPEETATSFGTWVDKVLGASDFSIGIFGIGTDGHTAGIKPHSPAVSSSAPAIFYEWVDYARITVTPPILTRLDEAIVYATGSEKGQTLRQLLHTDTPPESQPAQLLKAIKQSTLYTNIDLDRTQ